MFSKENNHRGNEVIAQAYQAILYLLPDADILLLSLVFLGDSFVGRVPNS